MPEPIVAAGSNRLYSWRPASYATMRRSKGGTARSNNSPQECPYPLWELLAGGDAGVGGCPEGGRDGGGCWHSLCRAPYCCSFGFSIIITDRPDCARQAHITALPLRAIRGCIRFAKRLTAWGRNTPLASDVNRCRCWARHLSWRGVALAVIRHIKICRWCG